MDVNSRRRSVVANKSSVLAGSVWESRMKSDEVKGGIKVFNGGGESEETQNSNNNGNNNLEENNAASKRNMKRGQNGNLVGVSGKRKTWKSESSFQGFEKNSNSNSNSNANEIVGNEKGKEVSVSANGGISKRSPVGVKKEIVKGRYEDGSPRSPIQNRKLRSESGQGIEKNRSIQLRKSKSESGKGVEKNNDMVELRKVKSEASRVESLEITEIPENDKNEKYPDENHKDGSEEIDICEEKAIASDLTHVGIDESNHDEHDDDEEEIDDEETEDEYEEPEIEKKSVDVKEINVAKEEEKQDQVEKQDQEEKQQDEEEEEEEKKPKNVIVSEVKKTMNQFHEKRVASSATVNKQPPPVTRRAAINSNCAKSSTSQASNGHQRFPETHSRMQNLVDLVMWRDVSKSALIFGTGTFIIISSSYTQDLHISFISVISYLGLVYLAAIFLYRSIICRGVIDDINDANYVIGEEEAVWLLKLILPYLNEFLLKIKALFSGDPPTTMKLAVLLFVLARCGSSITVWKMAKLGFFGIFIIPKVCSSYSTQLTAYGKFWIRRFRDAWDSCSHKKAVAFVVFTLVWNLSSVVARIWAVFMLLVALRYYQQSFISDDWVDNDEGSEDQTCHDPIGPRKEWRRPNLGQVNKTKKEL